MTVKELTESRTQCDKIMLKQTRVDCEWLQVLLTRTPESKSRKVNMRQSGDEDCCKAACRECIPGEV